MKDTYVSKAKSPYGRVSGETVTLVRNGDIIMHEWNPRDEL